MTDPRAVELSVTGVVNGAPLSARGTLNVDARAGTKEGTIHYSRTPGAVAPGPDCTPMTTGRCFIGARRLGRAPWVGPIELLGRDFVSLRVTRLGRYGTYSIAENASCVGSVLRSELTAIGEYRGPKVRAMGPLRETIRVTRDGTLETAGRYTLIPARGSPVRADYTHFYRPARPDRRLFARLEGTSFLLRARIDTSVRGKDLHYRSESTISPLKDRVR